MQKRQFEIVAQDPSVRDRNGRVLTATVSLPLEDLARGPMGYSLFVVDYDASTNTMYEAPPPLKNAEAVTVPKGGRKGLLADPGYHAMNAYAIAMRTLLRFEFALGRRVGWGIYGHQLKIVPHAFEEANAFYSPEMEALLFGYIRRSEPTFLCLSHDIVAHETAHALLDGLRDKFMAPSSPDQAALHEAFADIVALLSVFGLPELVQNLITPLEEQDRTAPPGLVRKSKLTFSELKRSALLGLAEEMRTEAADARVNALRRSVEIDPNPHILDRLEFEEEHRRGEVLVAAVMRAFLSAWVARIGQLGDDDPEGLVDVNLVAEQGADIADVLLTMVIRAIDYTPPIHIDFSDFLSAMLTADNEVRSDDSRYHLRGHLLTEMAQYGIAPKSREDGGYWPPAALKLVREGSHLSALQSDPTEMFRHIWNNRMDLKLDTDALTRITSVRPCVRVSPDDGFQIRETVVELVQYLKVTAAELWPQYRIRKPAGMPDDQEVVLEGGSTFILDEYGELKFEVSNRLPPPASRAEKQAWERRLQYLWDRGYFAVNRSSALASFHRQRALAAGTVDPDVELEAKERRASEGWNR
jgi:hypothetical protein